MKKYTLHIKIVIIVILSMALIASGVMLVKGLSDMNAKPGIPSPARKAPKPNVNIDKFLNEFDHKEQTAPHRQFKRIKHKYPRTPHWT